MQGLASRVGLVAGPVAALLLPWLIGDGDLDRAGRWTVGVGAWMAIWWLTEAIPVYATALLPLALFPWLGIASGRDAASPYGHELIFLFMGGFLIALAMERWGLHRRFAVGALALAGDRPSRVVGAFIATSALLSMWVSNTATAIMLLPVALSVLGDGDTQADHHFGVCLLLGIAYGCSIGGIATPIGTPPNVFLLSYLKSELGVEIGFVRWMAIGLPMVALFAPFAWWLLTGWLYPLDDEPIPGAEVVRRAHAEMGAMGVGEKSAAVAFAIAACLWVSRPLLAPIELAGARPFAGLTDASIAMGAALLLFVLPGNRPAEDGAAVSSSGRALDWETALRLPWGILVLFGGGLSLAAAIRANGVDVYIAERLSFLGVLPGWLVVVGVVAVVVFLTELTSNTATCATFVPLLAGMGPVLGLDPLLLCVPAAIAASFAFMLPVATPPNAVVFGSGRVSIAEMSRAGVWLNIGAIVGIPLFALWLMEPLLGTVAP